LEWIEEKSNRFKFSFDFVETHVLDGVPGFIIQKKVEKNVLFLIMVIVV
jgi:hypothetical protein